MRKPAVLMLISLALSTSAYAQVAIATETADPKLQSAAAAPIRDRIEQEAQKQQLVGMSIALVREGEIVHIEHIGWEDRERQIPASSQTMYRWASISKPLTAIAAMQLWEQGKLDLDRDIRELVPEFPEQEHTITCRQILCHQGGIVHYSNGKVVKTPRPDLNGRYESVIDALDTFKASPLVCEPGTKYSYSTHGYILASAVVERACGERTFPRIVEQQIITPLGMTTLRPDYQWIDIPNRAVGYLPGPRRQDGSREMVVSTNTDVSWKLAGGGYISNVQDLALLGAGMLEHRLVKPETRDLMWTLQPTRDGKATRYGLGFQISELNGVKLVSHSGSQEKARTLLLMHPQERAAVAIMTNTEGANLGPLGRDLLTMLISTRVEAAEPASAP